MKVQLSPLNSYLSTHSIRVYWNAVPVCMCICAYVECVCVSRGEGGTNSFISIEYSNASRHLYLILVKGCNKNLPGLLQL